MYVISLICRGKLRKTTFVPTDESAVKTAQEWYGKYKKKCERDGYIAIDYSVKEKLENIRFAELKFDRSDNEVKLYLVGDYKRSIFLSKYKTLAKDFLLSFFKYSVIKLADYLREIERREK